MWRKRDDIPARDTGIAQRVTLDDPAGVWFPSDARSRSGMLLRPTTREWRDGDRYEAMGYSPLADIAGDSLAWALAALREAGAKIEEENRTLRFDARSDRDEDLVRVWWESLHLLDLLRDGGSADDVGRCAWRLCAVRRLAEETRPAEKAAGTGKRVHAGARKGPKARTYAPKVPPETLAATGRDIFARRPRLKWTGLSNEVGKKHNLSGRQVRNLIPELRTELAL